MAYLLLGSNEGNRVHWLEQSIDLIAATCGRVVQRSGMYRTAAWGKEDQPVFLNMAIGIETKLSATQLLAAIQAIELELGRQREVKWGQRTLDIDIVFYNEDVIDKPDLTVPHPYLQDRRFVLVPLLEIAAGYIHPIFKKTVKQLLAECRDPLEVHIFQ